jgi:hypothetical protein
VSRQQSAPAHRPDGRVESWCVAATGEDADLHVSSLSAAALR